MGLQEDLAAKAEAKLEETIFEEGGYSALLKYKAIRLFKRCGCID